MNPEHAPDRMQQPPPEGSGRPARPPAEPTHVLHGPAGHPVPPGTEPADGLVGGLVAASTEMDELLTLYKDSHDDEVSRGLLIRCAGIGYALLSNEVYVQAMVDGARALQERYAYYGADMHAFMSVDYFDLFLRSESKLLEQAGMGPLLTEKVIRQCREAREAARREEFDAGRFRAALEELRDEVHRTLDQLREVSLAEHAARRLFRRAVDCFTGVCGCAVVGIDASALAATAGILGPLSAISGAVGCAMMGQAITGLSDAGRGLTAWRRLKRFCHRVVYGMR